MDKPKIGDLLEHHGATWTVVVSADMPGESEWVALAFSAGQEFPYSVISYQRGYSWGLSVVSHSCRDFDDAVKQYNDKRDHEPDAR